jgi:hypothetical protein
MQSNGTAKESLVRTSLENIAEDDKAGERVVAEAFGNIFSAAIDTVRPPLYASPSRLY